MHGECGCEVGGLTAAADKQKSGGLVSAAVDFGMTVFNVRSDWFSSFGAHATGGSFLPKAAVDGDDGVRSGRSKNKCSNCGRR